MRTSEIKIMAMRIAGINSEMPCAGVPVQRAIEVTCGTECVILPVEQDITEIQITVSPINAI